MKGLLNTVLVATLLCSQGLVLAVQPTYAQKAKKVVAGLAMGAGASYLANRIVKAYLGSQPTFAQKTKVVMGVAVVAGIGYMFSRLYNYVKEYKKPQPALSQLNNVVIATGTTLKQLPIVTFLNGYRTPDEIKKMAQRGEIAPGTSVFCLHKVGNRIGRADHICNIEVPA